MIGAGLARLRPAPAISFAEHEGLTDSAFTAVFQDREGRVWFGGDRVYWFDGRRFHLLPGVTDTIAIAQTSDGDLWFGGYDGLHRFRSGALTRFQVEAPAVNAIYQDREGTLWIGAVKEDRPGGGLYRFRDGKLDQISGISDVDQIIEDRDSGLLVFGIEGLFRVRAGQAIAYDTKQKLPSHIASLYQERTGTLWIATQREGLFRLRHGNLKGITAAEGLPHSTLRRIFEDGSGNLWASSNQGIFRFPVRELNDVADGKTSSFSAVLYGNGDGLRSTECGGGSPGIWKTSDGRLWFPTLRGVVSIDPGAGSPLPPPVMLEEAWANKLSLASDGRTSAPPGNNTFDFRFTALSLSAPERTRFKYRLAPFDTDWVDAGTLRTAHYTNMGPGEYHFQVIAWSSFGVWNRQGAGVRFVLQPHYYQTNWFRALCGLAFLALLWAAYQVRIRHLHSEFNVRLTERLDERARIARELHDTLLQSFQGLMFSFQAARNLLPGRVQDAIDTLDGAIRDGDEALAESRDAIQGLRNNPGRERDLEYLLTAAGKQLARASTVDGDPPVFQVAVEGARQPLSPFLLDEVYRIAREILLNAFHHAHASRIEVEVA